VNYRIEFTKQATKLFKKLSDQDRQRLKPKDDYDYKQQVTKY
jgi:mRNA-degrading endonuclease RelE of RelBE toxin-antitoxin system